MKRTTGVVFKSQNGKVGKGAMITFRPVGVTCPSTCPFLNNGCYAQKYHMRLASQHSPTACSIFDEQMGKITYKFVYGKAKKPTLLRFHTAGDIMMNGVIDTHYMNSLTRWSEMYKGYGIPVINYTHCWKDEVTAPMKAFTRASVHNVADAVEATQKQWHVAMAIDKGTANQVKEELKTAGLTGVHCPFQTNKITCAKCRLCEVKGSNERIILLEKH